MQHLQYVVEHVFMPPKLPQTAEPYPQGLSKEHALIQLLTQAAEEHADLTTMGVDRQQWNVVLDMLKATTDLHGSSPYTAEHLVQRFARLTAGNVIAILVRKQNAGLIIRHRNDQVVFEAFEVSAPAAVVVQSIGKLQMSFPASMVTIPSATFHAIHFQNNLASFLAQMNVDELDTDLEHDIAAHPKHITDLLVSLLAAVGVNKSISTPVRRVTKRIADDALLGKDRALGPWRRSPLWLVARVATQTTLSDSSEYKSLVIYFMTMLLEKARIHQTPFASTTLSHICTKIAGRIAKLRDSTHPEVARLARTTCETAQAEISRRWKVIRDAQSPRPRAWNPSTLDLDADTWLQLANSTPHISGVLNSIPLPVFTSSHIPSHAARISDYPFHEILRQKLSFFVDVHVDAAIVLADFEAAVRDYLNSWVDMSFTDTAAPELLLNQMKRYQDLAFKQYQGNAENTSLMVLVLLELWVALDKIVTDQIPLLLQYPPEVSTSLLEPLLFRGSSELARVKEIACHLQQTRSEGFFPSLFGDLSEQSFSVQYYNSGYGVRMQQAKAQIEQQARFKKEEKQRELARKNAAYNVWLRDFNAMSHDSTCRTLPQNRRKRKKNCEKCTFGANPPTIERWQWPLPEMELQQQNLLFELFCPPQISYWREATYFILHHCFSSSSSHVSNLNTVSDYMTTRQIALTGTSSSHITLASRSVQGEHRLVRLPAAVSDVCVAHEREWKLYDSVRQVDIRTHFHDTDTTPFGSLSLPPSDAYDVLQYAVGGTNHTENMVQAQQMDCKHNLSLHEFIAFGTLRSGGRLQWMNILRALATRSLTFSAQPVHVLVSQAVQQVGHLNAAGSPEWHVDLKSSSFSESLLAVLRKLLDDSVANWREVATVKTVILVTLRQLAAIDETGTEVDRAAMALLAAARETAYQWLRSIIAQLDTTPQQEVDSIKARICEIAAICCLTYEVRRGGLSSSDVSVLMYSIIALNAHSHSRRDTSSSPLRILMDRVFRLLHSLEDTLWAHIHHNSRGLDDALVAVWSAYERGTPWLRMPSPNERWLQCKTLPRHGRVQQTVQINLLSGELFIDGKPIGSLPKTITEHPMYARLFGKAVLRVVPAGVPDMDYKTVLEVAGHEVFFACYDGQVVVRTRSTASQNTPFLEYIPFEMFKGDLPTPFVEDYAHWLDLRAKRIEFRPLKTLWEPSQVDWHLNFDTRIMQDRRGHFIVDIQSPTFKAVSSRLSAFEHPSFIVVTKGNSDSSESCILPVHLPRFHLDFKLDTRSGVLESCTYPGTIVDNDQSLGTLYGLKTRLVLRGRSSTPAATLPPPRRVLIPRGAVSFNLNVEGSHADVYINTEVEHRREVAYLEYTVNTKLGTLTGNGSLEARLYKIYLHALTSHCAPDPLLERMGVEEALHELASAACFSFQSLKHGELELLEQIRSLTPRREYYPIKAQRTQCITWNSLPATSQVTAFEELVVKILAYDAECSVFRPKSHPAAEELSETSLHPLLRRAASRELGFVNVLTLPQPSRVPDTPYTSRDGVQEAATTHYAATVMVLAQNPRSFPIDGPPQSLYSRFSAWPLISKDGQDEKALGYHRRWLLQNDLNRTFLPIYDVFRSGPHTLEEKQYSLLFSLPAVAYGCPSAAWAIPYLAAFAFFPNHFRHIPTPQWTRYNVSYGTIVQRDTIQSIVANRTRPLEQTPSLILNRPQNEDDDAYLRRRRRHYDTEVSSRASVLVAELLIKWNTYQGAQTDAINLSLANEQYFQQYHHVTSILDEITVVFQECYHNKRLKVFTTQVEHSLAVLNVPAYDSALPPLDVSLGHELHHGVTHNVRMESLLRLMQERSPPPLDRHPLNDLELPTSLASSNMTRNDPSVRALEDTLRDFSMSTRQLQRTYGTGVQTSLNRLRGTLPLQPGNVHGGPVFDLGLHLGNCRAEFEGILAAIQSELSPQSDLEHIMQASGLWPSINSRSILFQMSRTQWVQLSDEWRVFITTFAIAHVRLQQAERLTGLSREEIGRELGNLHPLDVDWFKDHPDWLLIMIEQNFFIRKLQIQVASEMFKPSSPGNIALQLNMGEGKSSVIVPMIAASLANSDKLVRVVVLKPLAKQMYQLLVDRLSSLPNRRICYFPFSRQMDMGPGAMLRIHTLNMKCMLDGGVVVVQPEHILSAKLLTIDQLLSSIEPDATREARQDALDALDSERWLNRHARDILDESDEVLHARYQLIYTKGVQNPMEGHPNRWIVIQDMLRLVAKALDDLKEQNPALGNLLEVRRTRPWAFPHIRIAHQDGRDVRSAICAKVVQAVMSGALPQLPVHHLQHGDRAALRTYISNLDAVSEEADLKRVLPTAFATAVIVRGLLVHNLLIYVLEDRRWRVDYGLDLARLLLAVPYRAKDLPSPRSEFGHPDIAILLTCLSYYYHGLNEEQMDAALKHLLMLSDPANQYDQWMAEVTTDRPIDLQDINSINIDDAQQRHRVFELFHDNRVVINFYLSHIVFPKAAKEYPQKLPTSGWDLAGRKANVTTGFSGTNDNQYLLPTSIKQVDPVDQAGTNALVLSYLLRPENASYQCTRTCSGREFVALIARQSSIRVLLDVGAQMLDMSNQALAEHWLGLVPITRQVEAAIFFNEDDELTTVTRGGMVEPLRSSPFKQETSKCIVYLDDAHTRGTDLKLPVHWKAAVTLGKKVTKDRLVQGCMRMRLLGRGQSLAFYAPPEVDAAIRRVNGRPTGTIRISDVIKWCMLETCAEIEHHLPQWLQQGIDYKTRNTALQPLLTNPHFNAGLVQTLKTAWLQQEARTLEQMYSAVPANSIDPSTAEHQDLMARLLELGVHPAGHANMDEEQEREVIHEMEVERVLERPPRAVDRKHSLHDDVKFFVETGNVPARSNAFHTIPKLLQSWNIRHWSDHSTRQIFDGNFLATVDFALSIKHEPSTEFWKPVHWFLSTNVADDNPSRYYLVLISQWEAQHLLPTIRDAHHSPVRLHVYSPRVTRSAPVFDDFSQPFYSVPPLLPESPRPTKRLMLQLNLFSGQLYPSSFDDYTALRQFLGIDTSGNMRAESDGFVAPPHRRGALQTECPFSVSPVLWLRELIAVRRKGHDFALTPMGQLLHGNGHRLTAADFV